VVLRTASLLLNEDPHEVELSEEVLALPDPRSAPAAQANITTGEAMRPVVAGGARIPDGPDDDYAHFRLNLL
jgi:hypothetical protein